MIITITYSVFVKRKPHQKIHCIKTRKVSRFYVLRFGKFHRIVLKRWEVLMLLKGKLSHGNLIVLKTWKTLQIIYSKYSLREMCPDTEFFLVHIFPHSYWNWHFSGSDWFSINNLKLNLTPCSQKSCLIL